MSSPFADIFLLLPFIVLSAIGWFSRNWIQRWATKGIEHRYDSKLEELRASLKKTENEFKDQLQRKEREIEALRGPAMQMLVSQRNALALKRIEAHEVLWDCIHKMQPFKMAAEVMQRIKVEELAKKSFLDEKTKAFFEDLYKITNLEKMVQTEPHKARLYVSQTCWANFSAYVAIGTYATAVLTMFRSGFTDHNLLKQDSLKTLVAAALPHQVPFLEKAGITAAFYLMDELEENLLNELRIGLNGTSEADDVASAKRIVDASNNLTSQASIGSAH